MKKKKPVVKDCSGGHYTTEEKGISSCPICGKKLVARKLKFNKKGHQRPRTNVICKRR